jgi:hypothetical protein
MHRRRVLGDKTHRSQPSVLIARRGAGLIIKGKLPIVQARMDLCGPSAPVVHERSVIGKIRGLRLK